MQEPVTIHIEGMSCGHCLHAVRRALESLPGVTINSVQIGRAEVSYDPGQMEPGRLLAAIAEAGYQGVVMEGSAS